MAEHSIQIYDVKGNLVGKAPEDPTKLRAMIESKQYGFARGTKVDWVQPDGTVISTPADTTSVLKALATGYKIKTDVVKKEQTKPVVPAVVSEVAKPTSPSLAEYNTQIYNVKGKPVGEAPEDAVELRKLIESGEFGFARGTRINWTKPDGTVISTPTDAATVLKALDVGYKIETSGVREERQIQEEYGGALGQIATAGHAIGNTLSFGGLDAIGKITGGDAYVDAVKKIKRANPDLHTGVEIGTLIGAFLTPGGQGTAAAKLGNIGKLRMLAGAGKSGAAIRNVAKLGRGVEKIAFKALGGPQGGIVRQTLARGTAMGFGGAVEGGIYGTAQLFNEHSLGDTDITAEKLLQYIGMGSMYGGVAGAGMGAMAGGLISSSRAAVKRGWGIGNAAENMWERLSGRRVATDLGLRAERTFVGPIIRKGRELIGGESGVKKAIKNRRAVTESMTGGLSEIENAFDNIDTLLEGGSTGAIGFGSRARDFLKKKLKKKLKKDVTTIKDVDDIINSIDTQYHELKARVPLGGVLERDIKTALDRAKRKTNELRGVSGKDPKRKLRKVAEELVAAMDPDVLSTVKIKGFKGIKNTDTLGAAVELGNMLENARIAMARTPQLGTSMAAKVTPKLKSVVQDIQDLGAEYVTITRKGTKNVAQDLFYLANKLKRTLRYAEDVAQEGLTRGEVRALRPVLDEYAALHRTVVAHIENQGFYGKIAATQAELRALRKKAVGSNQVSKELYRQTDNVSSWRPELDTTEGAMEHFVNNIGLENNEGMELFFGRHLDDKRAYIRAIRANYDDLPTSFLRKLNKADEHVTKLHREYTAKYARMTLQNQGGDIAMKTQGYRQFLPMALGAGFGYAYGGYVGLAGGLALTTGKGGVKSVLSLLEYITGTHSLSAHKTLRKYLSGIVKKQVGGYGRAARMLVPQAGLSILRRSNWGEKKTKDKTRYEAFQRRSTELTSFLTDPEMAMNRVKKNVEAISDAAPKIAAAMQVKAVQSARYLYDQMPKPLDTGVLLEGDFKPSDLELAKFERIAAVVDNPDNAMKSLEAGTLTIEEVDALREVWPETYGEIVMMLAENLPQLRSKIPYRERVQLSILFPVPVEATMQPEFMAAMQEIGVASAGAEATGQPPGKKQPKTKLSKFSKLNLDSTAMTSNQLVEQNKIG